MKKDISSGLTGAELKKLVKNNRLPKKFITEENLKALSIHEYELMGDDCGYDTRIIEYCSMMLAKKFAPEGYAERKHKLLSKFTPPRKEERARTVFTRFKKIAIVAAAVIILIESISYSTLGSDVLTVLLAKFKQTNESQFFDDGSEHYLLKSRKYKSVEEFEAAENIDIIVPTLLPGDISFKTLSYSYDSPNKIIDVYYTDDLTTLMILDESEREINDMAVYEANGIKYYIAEDGYFMYWYYDGRSYNFNSSFSVLEDSDEFILSLK